MNKKMLQVSAQVKTLEIVIQTIRRWISQEASWRPQETVVVQDSALVVTPHSAAYP